MTYQACERACDKRACDKRACDEYVTCLACEQCRGYGLRSVSKDVAEALAYCYHHHAHHVYVDHHLRS